MIRISCTNCKTVLTIDDAFAGGVCRCQYCGTIQTVPAQGKSVAVGSAGQSMGGGKQLYQNDARSGTGLDDLAGIVASSGLTSGRLTRKPPASKAPARNMLPIYIGVGAVIALLVAVIIILAMRSGSTAAPGSSNAGENAQNSAGNGNSPAVTASTPNFCGTKLDASTVIYLIDCGSATQDYFGDLKEATIKSVATLGSEHKFAILFWNNGTDSAYPENSTTYANKENIDAARRAIEDLPAEGQTDVLPALKIAVGLHPDVIVLATGKGWDLDDKWLTGVMTARGASPVRIDAFNLGSNESPPLKSLATKTGGTYRDLSKADLRGE
jgi:hypothetical protein